MDFGGKVQIVETMHKDEMYNISKILSNNYIWSTSVTNSEIYIHVCRCWHLVHFKCFNVPLACLKIPTFISYVLVYTKNSIHLHSSIDHKTLWKQLVMHGRKAKIGEWVCSCGRQHISDLLLSLPQWEITSHKRRQFHDIRGPQSLKIQLIQWPWDFYQTLSPVSFIIRSMTSALACIVMLSSHRALPHDTLMLSTFDLYPHNLLTSTSTHSSVWWMP